MLLFEVFNDAMGRMAIIRKLDRSIEKIAPAAIRLDELRVNLDTFRQLRGPVVGLTRLNSRTITLGFCNGGAETFNDQSSFEPK